MLMNPVATALLSIVMSMEPGIKNVAVPIASRQTPMPQISCVANHVIKFLQQRPCTGLSYIADVSCSNGTHWEVVMDCNGLPTCWVECRVVGGGAITEPITFNPTLVDAVDFCSTASAGTYLGAVGLDGLGHMVGVYALGSSFVAPSCINDAAKTLFTSFDCP